MVGGYLVWLVSGSDLDMRRIVFLGVYDNVFVLSTYNT